MIAIRHPFTFLMTLILSLSTLCLSSCGGGSENVYENDLTGKDTEASILTLNDERPLRIEVDKQEIEEGWTSSFLEIKDFVFLSNERPVGKIDKVLFWEDRTYVLDKQVTQSLLCFDREGKLLHAVGAVGEGPGEFRKIYDAQINPYTNSLEVWDGPGQKLLSFDRNGQFLRETHVDVFASEFAPLSSSVYLFHQGTLAVDPSLQYKVIAVDVDSKEVKGKYFPLEEGEGTFRFRPAMALHWNHYNGHYYFIDPFDYHVYSFTDRQLARDFYVDCQSHAIPASLVSYRKPQQELINLLYDANYFGLIEMPIETQDYIYFSINNGVDIIHNIHHKSSGRTKSFRNVEDDLAEGLIGPPIGVNEAGEIIYAIDPGLFKMIVEGKAKHRSLTEAELIEKWKTERPLAYELYHRIGEFDNPILVRCTYNI